MNRPRLTVVAIAVLVLVALPACAEKYQAEQDGKDVGQAVCDIGDADDEASASAALEDLREEVSDLAGNYAVMTEEDRDDIEENLRDLLAHVIQGDEVLVQQDLTVIRRNLDAMADDLGDTGQAAVDGTFQGLDDCIDG